MEERKFIALKKEEFGIKDYIKKELGKGKISKVSIDYTPVGEKIVIFTGTPGFIIGKSGRRIDELTSILKKKFKLENPHIEISEIGNVLLDAQIVADDIAIALEKSGNLKFKVIAYRKLQDIMNAGALGCEFRISGKLPSDRAKSWRFSSGYLKKSGEPSKEVYRAKSVALTKSGIIGVKVAIMSPDSKIYDRIQIDDKIKAKIKENLLKPELDEKEGLDNKKVAKKKAVRKKRSKKEVVEESLSKENINDKLEKDK